LPAESESVPVDPDAAPDESTDDAPVYASRAERRRAQRAGGDAAAHHGADDTRQAARERSGRAHDGRASGTGGGRSYAFRRS
jgi:hypothetical protein